MTAFGVPSFVTELRFSVDGRQYADSTRCLFDVVQLPPIKPGEACLVRSTNGFELRGRTFSAFAVSFRIQSLPRRSCLPSLYIQPPLDKDIRGVSSEPCFYQVRTLLRSLLRQEPLFQPNLPERRRFQTSVPLPLSFPIDQKNWGRGR